MRRIELLTTTTLGLDKRQFYTARLRLYNITAQNHPTPSEPIFIISASLHKYIHVLDKIYSTSIASPSPIYLEKINPNDFGWWYCNLCVHAVRCGVMTEGKHDNFHFI
eukprot:GHVP01047956.1.p1 GENE.GHVP01047956.1~~GHVP01047956.1.p1  ORF type:complete len:108 (+),score=5.05 GHVP01047956.1:112-435(+)